MTETKMNVNPHNKGVWNLTALWIEDATGINFDLNDIETLTKQSIETDTYFEFGHQGQFIELTILSHKTNEPMEGNYYEEINY